MRLLVTGGAGFIGSNFIRFMLRRYSDIEIINLDKLTYCGNLENLMDIAGEERYSFVKGDICDKEIVEKLIHKTDAVINFAAETHVDRSIKYPDDFLRTNVFGVKNLLDAARKSNINRFVQISTDEVYGSVSKGFSKEEDALKPNSPYSAAKAAGDLLALSYYTTYGLPVSVVRSSNNFGPFQYPEKVMPLFITNLLREQKVPLYGDGGNIREWLFVEDNLAAIDLILNKGRVGEVYNVGGENRVTNFELTKKLLSAMNKNETFIEYVNDRPGHDRRYALDSSKIKALGWNGPKNFEIRLMETVKWYEDNKTWWNALKETAHIVKW
ncbi:MAG: dTDP-glucose 4,6-dehydratase [Candidatus Omnitrophota bacterium]